MALQNFAMVPISRNFIFSAVLTDVATVMREKTWVFSNAQSTRPGRQALGL
jgi:hypothetical protein